MLAFGEKGEKAPYSIKLLTKAQLVYSLSKFKSIKVKQSVLAKSVTLVDSKSINILILFI